MSRRLIIFTIILAATGGLLSFHPVSNYQELWKAPSWTDTLKNPYAARWGANAISPVAVLETQALYNTYCATCHGATGKGDGVLGSALDVKPANFHTPGVKEQNDGALFWKIGAGRGKMPAYVDIITEDNRWKLVTYIRQLSIVGYNTAGTLKFAKVSSGNFSLKPGMSSQYFPLPSTVKNVISSNAMYFMVDTVVSGLKRPYSMLFLPDGRMLIADRSGNLWQTLKGKLSTQHVTGNIPTELRDMKLHPQFQQNGLIYITYYIAPSKTSGGYTAIMRGKLVGDKLINEEKLYQAGPFNQGPYFYGSKIVFDNKGYLYFTVGITGDRKNAQDLSKPAGKTMRLKDDGTIPADNPFTKVPGALPEIYSYGHRMHQGLFFDQRSSKLYATEFGELGGDELNVVKAGANYGWPQVTFSREYSGVAISPDSLRADIEAPVHHWTFAPSDLDRVTGDNYPGWDGNLFIGGLLRKSLLRVVLKDGIFQKDEVLLENLGRIRDVEFGPDKFLYVMTEDSGVIVRLLPLQNRMIMQSKK